MNNNGLTIMDLLRYLILAGFIASPHGTVIAGDDTLMRFELDPYSSRTGHTQGLSPGDPLNQVKVFLEIDTVQPDETQGLALAIEIINESDETIVMTDPSEFIGISLLGDKNRVCNLPPVAHGTHTFMDPDPEAVRARLAARRAYVIDSPTPGTYPNTTKTVRDVVTDPKKAWMVTLGPGERFWLPLRITEVQAERLTGTERVRKRLQEDEQHGVAWMPPPPERAPISAGLYTLGVGTGVSSRKDYPHHFSRKSFIIIELPTPIRLGEPAAE